MTKFLSLAMLASFLTVGLSAGVAQADDDHRRCSWVRKCEWHDGRRHCEREKVCRERHDHERRDHERR